MAAPRNSLFVSGFLPSPRLPSGGQQLVYRELVRQAGRGHVHLLAFCNAHERPYFDPADYAICQTFRIFDIGLPDRLMGACFLPSLPLVASARAWAAKAWLTDFLARVPPDEIWIEFVQGAFVLDLLPPRLPSTLVVHDLFSQAWVRRAELAGPIGRRGWGFEARRTRTWEQKVLSRASRLITLTDKDRDALAAMTGRTDVTVRYPDVDQRYASVRRDRHARVPDSILFWGLMSRHENQDAAVWFCTEVLPRIRARRPRAKFIIAGANPTARVRALAGDAVSVLGFVEDPHELFSTAAMAVAPLRLGAGIKIKVVEYLAAGLPTVATKVGAEGVVSSPQLHVAEGADAFAESCLTVLAREERSDV